MKQKGFRRIVCAVCLLLSFLLSSCSLSSLLDGLEEEKPEDGGTSDAPHLTLGFFENDSLVPYFAQHRTNREVLTLVFCGLYAVDASYTAQPVLAERGEWNGNTLTVTLREQAVFSDGSPLTAEDCVFSYNLAASDGSVYRDRFSSIRAWRAVDDRTFEVEFSSGNPYQVNLLDLPILRTGTETADLPVGAGRYFFKRSPEKTGKDGLRLYRNENFPGEPAVADTVELTLVSSDEDFLYAFNYGGSDVLYRDLAGGTASYRVSAQTVPCLSNRLTYAAINPSREIFSNGALVLRALQQLTDRASVDALLGGCGKAVWTPFNPGWSVTQNAGFAPDTGTEDGARDAFYKARWYRNSETQRLEWYGKEISLTIIVAAENAFEEPVAQNLAARLESFGVRASVRVLGQKDYAEAVRQGTYDLRIGTVEISADMNLSALYADARVPVSAELQQKTAQFLRGECSAVELNTVFQEQLPLIPLYYTSYAVAVNMRVEGTFLPTPTSLLGGQETWEKKK